jgi:hypothetical protein
MIDNQVQKGHICHKEISGISDRNHGPAIPKCIAEESLIAAVIMILLLIVYAILSPLASFAIESNWFMMLAIPFIILITVYFVIQCQITKYYSFQ